MDTDRIFVWPNEVVLKSSVEKVLLPEHIKFVFGGEEIFPEIFRVIVVNKDTVCDHRLSWDFWYSIDGQDRLYAYYNDVAYNIRGAYELKDSSMTDRTFKAVDDLYDIPDIEDGTDTINLYRIDIEKLPGEIILQ